MSWQQLQGALLKSLVIGIAVLLALSLFSDVQSVWDSFSSFQWAYLPLISGLTVLNYVLRWLKWDYFLRYLKMGQGVSRGDSGLMFTAGMVMAVTPGKVGEVFKSALLKRVNSTPITASAPIVLVERITDGIAMLLLMALGLTLYPPAWSAFVLLVVLTVAGVVLAQNRPLCHWLIDRVGGVPLGAKIAPRLTTLYASTHQLLHWRVLLGATVLSVVSWGCECIAFYYVLVALGVPGTPLLLLQATFIFAASTLLGLVSFLPGGLGASEISSVGLLNVLVGMSAAAATTATIIIRFATLWFGVGVGVVALLWFRRRYPAGAGTAPAPPAPAG